MTKTESVLELLTQAFVEMNKPRWEVDTISMKGGIVTIQGKCQVCNGKGIATSDEVSSGHDDDSIKHKDGCLWVRLRQF